jgi:hypothetical protein
METLDINALWRRNGADPPPVPYAQYYWDIFVVIHDKPEYPLIRLMDIDGVVYLAARNACQIQSMPDQPPRYIIAPKELVRISCQKAIEPYDDTVYSQIIVPLIRQNSTPGNR